jgi:hypothetical protein
VQNPRARTAVGLGGRPGIMHAAKCLRLPLVDHIFRHTRARRHDLDSRHPAVDTFERALDKGIVVAAVDRRRPPIESEESGDWFDVPLAGVNLLEESSPTFARSVPRRSAERSMPARIRIRS